MSEPRYCRTSKLIDPILSYHLSSPFGQQRGQLKKPNFLSLYVATHLDVSARQPSRQSFSTPAGRPHP
jgi:hypothetical protein